MKFEEFINKVNELKEEIKADESILRVFGYSMTTLEKERLKSSIERRKDLLNEIMNMTIENIYF